MGTIIKIGTWEPSFEGIMVLSFFNFASDMVISAWLVNRQYSILKINMNIDVYFQQKIG